MTAFGGKTDIKLLESTHQTLHPWFFGSRFKRQTILGGGRNFLSPCAPRLAFLTSMLSMEQQEEYGPTAIGMGFELTTD